MGQTQKSTRSFLRNKTIVQAMLAFREGEMLRIPLEHYLDMADYVVVMLDNYDEATRQVVLEYLQDNPDKLLLYYSSFPGIADETGFKLNRRFKQLEGEIRNELLSHVHRLNEEVPVDILLWGDADEVFTSGFPADLERFVNSKKSALLCSHIQMIDDFHHFHNRRFYSHCKAFKYRSDLSTVPMRGQCLLNPYQKYQDTTRSERSVVHMADFTRDYMNKRAKYKQRPFPKDVYVWKSAKDVRELTATEYQNIVGGQEPVASMNEYLYGKG